MRRLTLSILALLTTLTSFGEPLKKIHNVTVKDLYGEPAMIPQWGEKYLLIFYIDPDRASMNLDFTDQLEANKSIESPNILGLGVINRKDAPMTPNSLAKMMARKRTEKNGATVLSDEGRILSTEWELGSCNNQFVLIVVSPDEEILFLHKGIFEQENRDAFFEVIEKIKAEV